MSYNGTLQKVAKFGATPDNVNLFTFYWNDVKPNTLVTSYGGLLGYLYGTQVAGLHDQHAAFNYGFVQTFPKLLYTNPFTMYNDSGIGITSSLRGTGETTLDAATVRNTIIAGAQAAGIAGNPANLNVDLKSIRQIQDGGTLQESPSSVDKWATKDGADAIKTDWIMYGLLGFAALILLTGGGGGSRIIVDRGGRY